MDLMYTAHVPAGEGPFPTIFALHGWGAGAHDLFGLAPYLHGGQALVVCPQGPVRFQTGPGMEGYGWFPITGGGSLDPAEFTKGRLLLRDFVERIFEILPDVEGLLKSGFRILITSQQRVEISLTNQDLRQSGPIARGLDPRKQPIDQRLLAIP